MTSLLCTTLLAFSPFPPSLAMLWWRQVPSKLGMRGTESEKE